MEQETIPYIDYIDWTPQFFTIIYSEGIP
jgi:hypothetical protein